MEIKFEEAQGYFGRKYGTGQRKRRSSKGTKEEGGFLTDDEVEDWHRKVQSWCNGQTD
jgi:hypothetical protein